MRNEKQGMLSMLSASVTPLSFLFSKCFPHASVDSERLYQFGTATNRIAAAVPSSGQTIPIGFVLSDLCCYPPFLTEF